MFRKKLSRGQVTIELAISFFCLMLLVYSSFKIAAWAVGRMVKRQVAYEVTRGSTDAINREVQIYDSSFPRLDIFN